MANDRGETTRHPRTWKTGAGLKDETEVMTAHGRGRGRLEIVSLNLDHRGTLVPVWASPPVRAILRPGGGRHRGHGHALTDSGALRRGAGPTRRLISLTAGGGRTGVWSTSEQGRAALVQAFGPRRVLTDSRDRMAYAYDATGEKYLCDAVFFPESTAEVVEAVRIARRHGLPVVPRGAGTNISGGTLPVRGGLVLAMNRMNRILAIDPDDRIAAVQPGVPNIQLQQALAPHGFFFAADPGSHRVSTLGGNVAENSGGPHCLKYGVTTNHVRGLEVVLADGEVVRVGGRTQEAPPGYDLLALLVGAEGTLAVVTAIDLHILPLPPSRRTILAVYDQLEAAATTVSAIVAARLVPASIELLDRGMIACVEPFAHAGYPADADAVLLIEVDGTPAAVERAAARIAEIATGSGARQVRSARDQAEQDALWLGRRVAYGAAARLSAHVWTQDVTVPRDRMVEALRAVEAIGRKWRVQVVTVAHAGDGNLHPLIPFNPQDHDEVERMKAADHEIVAACVKLGGSVTGEHGVGIDKLPTLPLQYGPAELEVMQRLKRALDPDEVLNPGKAIPAPRRNV